MKETATLKWRRWELRRSLPLSFLRYTNTNKHISWTGLSVPGKEVLTIDTQPDRYVVHSKVIGGDADLGMVWDISYTVICDRKWRVRQAVIHDNRTDHHLMLQSDGAGHWIDGDKVELSNLNGCIDIDFRATPFSNTLPVRRLNLAPGESSVLDVVYINAPDLVVTKELQIILNYPRRSGNSSSQVLNLKPS